MSPWLIFFIVTDHYQGDGKKFVSSQLKFLFGPKISNSCSPRKFLAPKNHFLMVYFLAEALGLGFVILLSLLISVLTRIASNKWCKSLELLYQHLHIIYQLIFWGKGSFFYPKKLLDFLGLKSYFTCVYKVWLENNRTFHGNDTKNRLYGDSSSGLNWDQLQHWVV